MNVLVQREEVVSSTMYILPFRQVYHEYNGRDQHRLRFVYNIYRTGQAEGVTGWYEYDEIAMTEVLAGIPEYRQERICATTEYWQGKLPRVFRTIALEEADHEEVQGDTGAEGDTNLSADDE